MSSEKPKQVQEINAPGGKPFAKMSAFEKVRHVGKVIVFFLSFGFAFPNVFSD